MTNLIRSNFQDHPFHLVTPSPWPLFTSVSLFNLATSGALSMHNFHNGYYLNYVAFFLVVSVMSFWFRDIITEAKKNTYSEKYKYTPSLHVGKRLNIGKGAEVKDMHRGSLLTIALCSPSIFLYEYRHLAAVIASILAIFIVCIGYFFMALIEILSLISIFQWVIILFCLLPLVSINFWSYYNKEMAKHVREINSLFFTPNRTKLNIKDFFVPWIKSNAIYITIFIIIGCIIGIIRPEIDYEYWFGFFKNEPYLCIIILIIITQFFLVLNLISVSTFKEKLYFGVYLLTLRLTLFAILNMIINESTGEIILSMSIYDMLLKLGVIDNISVQFKGFTNIFQGFTRISKFIKALGALINLSRISTGSVLNFRMVPFCNRLPSSKCTLKLVSKSSGSKFQPNTFAKVLPSNYQSNINTIIEGKGGSEVDWDSQTMVGSDWDSKTVVGGVTSLNDLLFGWIGKECFGGVASVKSKGLDPQCDFSDKYLGDNRVQTVLVNKGKGVDLNYQGPAEEVYNEDENEEDQLTRATAPAMPAPADLARAPATPSSYGGLNDYRDALLLMAENNNRRYPSVLTTGQAPTTVPAPAPADLATAPATPSSYGGLNDYRDALLLMAENNNRRYPSVLTTGQAPTTVPAPAPAGDTVTAQSHAPVRERLTTLFANHIRPYAGRSVKLGDIGITSVTPADLPARGWDLIMSDACKRIHQEHPFIFSRTGTTHYIESKVITLDFVNDVAALNCDCEYFKEGSRRV